MDLKRELAQYGPGQLRACGSDEARAYCRTLAESHYENFPVLSVLLPKSLRPHFAHVYAYCRWADDLADESDPAAADPLLDWWKGSLEDLYRGGEPRHPVFVALRETVHDFDLPIQPFADLLSAFRQDQSKRRYESFEELLDYCRRSANPVGRLVLGLARVRSAEALQLSDWVCTGLQLANFCQDVCIDADKGRVYLPAEHAARFGLTTDVAECMGQRRWWDSRLSSLLRYEVEIAENFLRHGRRIVSHVPGRWKGILALFVEGGLGILRSIRLGGFDVRMRPKLRKSDYVAITGRAMAAVLRGR